VHVLKTRSNTAHIISSLVTYNGAIIKIRKITGNLNYSFVGQGITDHL
jgi:hypothetical protein